MDHRDCLIAPGLWHARTLPSTFSLTTTYTAVTVIPIVGHTQALTDRGQTMVFFPIKLAYIVIA